MFTTPRIALASVVLGSTAAFGQADPPTVLYEIDTVSSFTAGCYDPCQCPLFFFEDLTGTFELTFTESTPDGFDRYAVSNVQWTVGFFGAVVGNGTFDVGGELGSQQRLQLDLAFEDQPPEHFDSGLVGGGSTFPTIDLSVNMNELVCYDQVFNVVAAPATRGVLARPFCSGSDGSLAACPCGNPGSPGTGCDIAQGTGGVGLSVVDQDVGLPRATLQAAGFPSTGSPTSILIRNDALDPETPVVFGDGLRCVGTSSLVRLAATTASGGVATHVFGHGAMAGSGTFYYQAWFRNTPAMYCDPAAAFNLSSGEMLDW